MASKKKTLSEIEEASYRSRWRDGTLDLCGGLGVLFTGLAWEREIFWAPGFAVPVLILLWSFLRKYVVETRIGRVTFGKERREKEKGGTRGAIWAGGGLLFLIVAYYAFQMRVGGTPGAWVQDWISALPVALLSLMALTAAAMVRQGRFLWYAGILLLVGLIGAPSGMEPGLQILFAGAIITFLGGLLLVRFLRDFPVRTEEGVGA